MIVFLASLTVRKRSGILYSLFLTEDALSWDYSGHSYSGLVITEYTEFQFSKRTLIHYENGILMTEVT